MRRPIEQGTKPLHACVRQSAGPEQIHVMNDYGAHVSRAKHYIHHQYRLLFASSKDCELYCDVEVHCLPVTTAGLKPVFIQFRQTCVVMCFDRTVLELFPYLLFFSLQIICV